ncbi:MAG: hypothetical protein EKK41_29270 [Hyphomicrobiales bacterium]|nr:MAG: hypothetical protein EKK41_29270 [Hyphomicrobiales bacterium]
MTPPAAPALLAHFEAAAKVAQAQEVELRKKLAAEIAMAEQRRVYAFRRSRLIGLLSTSLPAQAGTEDEAWAAQKRAVCEDLGWSALSESYQEILARMEPVAAAVRSCLATPQDDKAAPAVVAELERFEAWFLEAKGKPFYVLFDQYVPEVPVVDF